MCVCVCLEYTAGFSETAYAFHTILQPSKEEIVIKIKPDYDVDFIKSLTSAASAVVVCLIYSSIFICGQGRAY